MSSSLMVWTLNGWDHSYSTTLKKTDYHLQSVWKQYKSEFYGTGAPDSSAVDSDVTMGEATHKKVKNTNDANS